MISVWRPILEGEEAESVLAIAREIAEATTEAAEVRPDNVQPQAFTAWQNSLDGRAGQSLLQAYLFLHEGAAVFSERALTLLDQAVDAVATVRLPPGLYFGFSGIGWVGAHLSGRLFEEEEDNGLPMDVLLLKALARKTWEGKYDLFEGLVGLGVLALERLPRPSAAKLLESVVTHLEERALITPDGASFFSPPESLNATYRALFPNGFYNLGMAHGVLGVITLLAGACQAGVAGEKAGPLLSSTVAWLLSREQAPERTFRFATAYPQGIEEERSRLGWCHGDLSVAVALFVAAQAVGHAGWEATALRLAREAAARSPQESRIVDAGICHGAAGVGHLFNRLYQATGEVPLGEAARFWLRHAVQIRQPGAGVAGYLMMQGGQGFDHRGFRIGASGVGLALLAAVSSVEPAWDRLLLASLAGSPNRTSFGTSPPGPSIRGEPG